MQFLFLKIFIIFMKKQKNVFLKFQKKYIFFQKSFFDFLYWRAIQKENLDSSVEMLAAPLSNSSYLQNKLKMYQRNSHKYSPFEQEKMTFYQYWKRNQIFHMPNEEQKKKQKLLKSSKKFQFFDSKSFVKNKKNFSNSKQNLNLLTNQKLHFLFFKKRKQKFNNFRKNNLNNENFLSWNHKVDRSAVQSNFMQSKRKGMNRFKIGNFFPKKKFFIQYWIFPFLGILFFFSQNTSGFLVQKEKKFQNFIFEPLQNMEIQTVPKFLICSFENRNPLSLEKSVLNIQNKNNKELEFFLKRNDYSFAQKNSRETSLFQNLEKMEYRQFLTFFLNFFENTQKNDLTTIFFFPKNVKNMFLFLHDCKKNTFHWKWFSLQAKKFNPQTIPLISSRIPQKAEFFIKKPSFFRNDFSKNNDLGLVRTKKQNRKDQSNSSESFFKEQISFPSTFSLKKNNRPSTPLFDYSKILFSVDELNRDLNFSEISLPLKNFILNTFLYIAEEHFYSNHDKFDFSENILKNVNESKNLVFLKNWEKKQKFLNFQLSQEKKMTLKKNSFFLPREQKNSFSVLPILMISQRHKTSLNKDFERVNNLKLSLKFENLDALYFQKLFYKLNSLNLEKKISLESFQHLYKQSSRKEKRSFFFCKYFQFKKQTFHFFLFQYFTQSHKKFSKYLISQNFQSTKILASSFLNLKPKFYNEKKKRIRRNKKNNDISQKRTLIKNFFFLENFGYSHQHSNKPIFFNNNQLFLPFKLNSPILFHFFFNKQLSQKPFKKTQITDLQLKKTIFPSNFSAQFFDFSLYPFFKQKIPFFFFHLPNKNNTNFSFYQQYKNETKIFKVNFLEKCIENFCVHLSMKNIQKLFFNFYKFDNFQKYFLFETSQYKKPLIFKGYKNQEEHLYPTLHRELDKKKNFFLSNQFYILKSRKNKLFFVEKKKNVKAIPVFYSGFFKKQRKFEKTFQAFFSPLKNLKNSFSFTVEETQNNFLHQSQNFYLQKKEQQPYLYAKVIKRKKTKKDLFFLKSLSILLQKNSPNTFYSFYIPHNKKFLKNKLKKISFFNYLNEEKNFFQKKFLQLYQTEKFQKFQKNRLSPQLVLKRDGFLTSKKYPSEDMVHTSLENANMQLSVHDQMAKVTRFSSAKGLYFCPTVRVAPHRRADALPFASRERGGASRADALPTAKQTASRERGGASALQCGRPEGTKQTPKWHLLRSRADAGQLGRSGHSKNLRLEKEKTYQKKRRLKKEKLETRRRKKRKRFFPRPLWLRMNLYKKFLTTRHSRTLHSSLIQEFNYLSLQKKFSVFSTSFLKRKTRQKWFKNTEKNQLHRYFLKNFSLSSKFYEKKKNLLKRSIDFHYSPIDLLFFKKQNFNFQNKTYQKNFEKDSLFSHPTAEQTGFVLSGRGADQNNSVFFNKKGIEKVSKNIEYYKISNEIYQEFLKYSWKSSWFQNNFKAYTQAIEENFQKIQSLESQKNFSSFFDIFKNKNYVFFFNDFPFFSEQIFTNFLVEKSVFQKFSWYSNVQNSFTLRNGFFKKQNETGPYPLNCKKILQKSYSLAFFPTENSLKKYEYNRILYARISEILKQFKFSEYRTNSSFFESMKVNKRQNEQIFATSKNSFFTKTALFFEKFQVPSEPVIPAFSAFSSLFQDFSIKPTGDIPTLRAMWAFQKTNFSHFQERNTFQNLWSFKKRKDSLNAFKSTKKIINFLRKYTSFEKLKTPKQFSLDWSMYAFTPFFKRDFQFFEKLSSNKNAILENNRENIQDTKKISFLASKKTDFFLQDLVFATNPLDCQTFNKFQTVEKKSSLFGIQALKRHSKISQRYLKYYFSPKYQEKNFYYQKSPITTELNISQFPKSFSRQENVFHAVNEFEKNAKFLKNKNAQNSGKSSLNFWWIQRPFQNFDFLGTSQFHILSDFSNFKKYETKEEIFSFQSKNLLFTNSFVIFSAFFFHFAVFYTFFKIPEIRSVFKLTLLIFSKFLNAFFLVFFTIYNIFKKYTINGFNFLKNFSTFADNEKTKKNRKQNRNDFVLNLASLKIKQKNSKFQNSVFEFFPRSFSLSEKKLLVRQSKKEEVFFQSLKAKPGSLLHTPFVPDYLHRRADAPPLSRKANGRAFAPLAPPLYRKANGRATGAKQIVGCMDGEKWKSRPQSKDLRNLSFSLQVQKNIQKHHSKLSKTDKFLSQVAFSVLVFSKQILFIPYNILKFSSSIYTKFFEIFENIFYAFYKFLEKPAEFMIEFIAFVFLIEWSSDILGFFPDSIQSSLWKSSQKLLRPVRTGTFFLSFGVFFFSTSANYFSKSSFLTSSASQNFLFYTPFQYLFLTGFLNFSNFAAYVFQKRLFYVFENIPSILLQPDVDILVRQRKGIIFWDIWAEILLKAAEKYNVNLPSFVTLKEEQELFIEKLVHDSEFFQNLEHTGTKRNSQKKVLNAKKRFLFPINVLFLNKKANLPSLLTQKKSISKNFSSVSRTHPFTPFKFILQNRPLNFFDFSFMSQNDYLFSFLLKKENNTEKVQQFLLTSLYSSEKKVNHTLFQPFFNILKNKQFFTPLSTTDLQNNKFFSFFEKNKTNSSLQIYSKSEDNFLFEEILSSVQNIHPLWGKVDCWESSQYATFQSKETDFFLDIYPPKSLKHVHFLKYYEPAQYTLGSLICQIYAGIFSKQISKNILVVGEAGTTKTFFLRALAGETEMKIITENASRYAIVQRGVAVGMKYLRDVFDAIALQTPCFFVMEDLHIIGSKRPFMLSENENTQSIQSSFGLEQQEVHETNQFIYQSSRHLVSDFRRPYKGDFSQGIPTNSFLKTYFSSFFSTVPAQQQGSVSTSQGLFYGGNNFSFHPIKKNHLFQNSQFFGGNFSSSIWNFLSSPLPIDSLEVVLKNRGVEENNSFESNPHFRSGGANPLNIKKIQSVLQISKEQTFAPPATSPFTVLMMKEQKKLKAKKIVQEMSWGGFSADQNLLSRFADQKENFSIRAKIAVLAEKTMNLSRGKFDMITDFLVIIDSVRSNRGFIVFGTTHKPSSLDSALRRPGRFDETLSLARTPNFFNRFEIFKMNFENSVSTFDFFDSSILTENFSEINLSQILSQTKLSFFHNYIYDSQKVFVQTKSFSVIPTQKIIENSLFKNKTATPLNVKKQVYSQTSPIKAFHVFLKSSIFEDFYTQKQWNAFFGFQNMQKGKPEEESRSFLTLLKKKNRFQIKNTKHNKSKYFSEAKQNFSLRDSNFFVDNLYTLIPKGPSHMLTLAYSKLGTFLAEANLFNFSEKKEYFHPTAFVQLTLDIEKNSSHRSHFQKYYGNILFDSYSHSKNQKNSQIVTFLSGKIAEFLISPLYPKGDPKGFCFATAHPHCGAEVNYFSAKQMGGKITLQNFSMFFEKNSMSKENFLDNYFFTKIKSNSSPSQVLAKKDFYWTVYGNEENWRSTTPFLQSLIQKRFLFTKNLLLSKMLFFENMDQLRKPPNPPGSSILMPSKKYENFKRTEGDFFQKGYISIHEKIQMHQKQRFLKQLYNIPVQKYFRSEVRKNKNTHFNSSFQEFAYLDSFVQRSSSSYFYYRKYIQVRHRFSNINQWWNGMFPEHTRETTYLSDVDWRTMFVSSPVLLNSLQKTEEKKAVSSSNRGKKSIEFLMDFPDAEQYYNPRNRRWFFKSNIHYLFPDKFSDTSSFWSIFEKNLQYEIFSHFLMESFYQSFSSFEKKREMLDFFAFNFLSKGFLKELDLLATVSRF